MRAIVGLVMTVLVIGITGCAGAHLHHPDDEAAAKAAQKSFAEAELGKSLVAERANQANLLKRQLEVVKRDQSSLRDQKILAYIKANKKEYSWDALIEDIDKRLTDLIGSPDNAAKITAELGNISDSVKQMALKRDQFSLRTGGKAVPECSVDGASKESAELASIDSFLQNALNIFNEACKNYISAKKSLANALDSEKSILFKTNQQLGQIADEQAELKKERKQNKDEYDSAVKAYKEASAVPVSGKIEEAAARLKAALDKLAKPTAKLEKLADDPRFSALGLEGLVDKLSAHKAAVDTVISALQGDQGNSDAKPGPETQTALRIASLLSGFERRITTGKYPEVSILLLESEYLRLQLAAVEGRIARAKERVGLLEKKRDAMYAEVVNLGEARKWFNAAYGVTPPNGKSECDITNSGLFVDFTAKSATPRCKELVALTLVAYSNAWTFGRIPQEEMDYRLIASRHDSSLDASENALAQSENLIRIPIEQLVKLHSSGITAADIANIVNAVGLSAIAVRVK